MRVLFVMAGLLGCGTTDPAADRAAFLALDCARIVDTRLRDECLVFSVKEGRPADPVCGGVEDPVMRDECWFVGVDAQELTGAAAAHACGGAGRFVSACHANAISREVSRLPAMEEAALEAEIDRIIRQFRQPRPGEAREMARRRVGSR